MVILIQLVHLEKKIHFINSDPHQPRSYSLGYLQATIESTVVTSSTEFNSAYKVINKTAEVKN
eukprot:10722625-Ditylum_brightwellii.AAC.1